MHYSSGVANHFFYLLAEGSGAKTISGVAYNSPTCNGSTVTGIGRDKPRKIWYRALTVYMTSTTNYAGARDATLNAARDLYGADIDPAAPRWPRPGRRSRSSSHAPAIAVGPRASTGRVHEVTRR